MEAAEHQKVLKKKGILLDDKDQEKSSSDSSDDSDFSDSDKEPGAATPGSKSGDEQVNELGQSTKALKKQISKVKKKQNKDLFILERMNTEKADEMKETWERLKS